ncbi:MAG: 2-C-methyl-D-erythritol 4-phosphate cytidylyltransferase [Candidatus Binataceae bacterium]
MRASAIIVAAGSGSRLGRAEPKAFVPLGGHPMLYYSLAAVARVAGVVEIIVTVPAGMEKTARAQALAAGAEHLPIKFTPGGAERQDSVRIALALVSAESDLVIVHDAARPMADPDLFGACLFAAERAGGAIAAIPVADTLKRVTDGAITATIARAGLWQAQTPQAFRRSILIAAHERAIGEKFSATDDADLAERIGARIEVVESVWPNLKITTPADLAMADAILASRDH